jgi:hypothetical protein
MITFKTPKHHWNYFLALEQDLEHVSRYIEFSNANLNTYSIELTHLLLSASSEVDVVMKQLCLLVAPNQTTKNIDHYKSVIRGNLSEFMAERITIDRFGLSFKPWENWEQNKNPNWWRSYNNVKHQRNEHYNKANLQNTINALGALLLTVVYYYKLAFSNEAGYSIDFKETTRQLEPESTFLKIDADYYFHTLIV